MKKFNPLGVVGLLSLAAVGCGGEYTPEEEQAMQQPELSDVEQAMDHLPHNLEYPTVRLNGVTTVREGRRTLLPGLLLGADADLPDDLRDVSTRRLRTLCNHVYQRLDLDRPSSGSREDYHAVVEELERREAIAEQPGAEGAPSGLRDTAVVLPFVPGAVRRRIRLPRTARTAGRDRR